MVYRKLPDDLSGHPRTAVLDAMGRCREAIIAASDKVRPFGPAYKALQVAVEGIDSVAAYLTGDPTYYHAAGSAPGSGWDKWRDSGA